MAQGGPCGHSDGQYSTDRAMFFLHLSNAAYCDKGTIDDWSCPPCTRATSAEGSMQSWQGKTFTDAATSGQVFVGAAQCGGVSKDGYIVVSFRGTLDLGGLMKDLQFFKTTAYPKCDGCEVHGGFYSSWQALQKDVVDEVKRLRGLQPSASIFVTGHSLGAALAVLAATELHYSQGLKIEAVFTFGLPRVGNKAFKNFYSKASPVSWRVTHLQDPVPHLPPRTMDFFHSKTEVWYHSSSNATLYRECDSSGEDASCSDSVFPIGYPGVPTDHLEYLGIPAAVPACLS